MELSWSWYHFQYSIKEIIQYSYSKKYDLEGALISLCRIEQAMDVCCVNQLCKDLGRQQSILSLHIIQKRTPKGLRRENIIKSPSFPPALDCVLETGANFSMLFLCVDSEHYVLSFTYLCASWIQEFGEFLKASWHWNHKTPIDMHSLVDIGL